MRLVRVELRHAAGHELATGDEVLVTAHPDALSDALRAAAAGGALTVGVGAAFAVAVDATIVVWITGGAAMLSLPAALRPRARAAHLVLEDARLETARALGRALSH